MKRKYSFLAVLLPIITLIMACSNQQSGSPDPLIQSKVDAFATVKLTTDLSSLTENERAMIPHLIEAAKVMDRIFWTQAYGDKEELLKGITDPAMIKFLEINYGPWERLNGNEPFLTGVGAKPSGAQFYPTDMTKEEFEAFESDDKTSLYTIIRRQADGSLESVPYHVYYQPFINEAIVHMEAALALAEDAGFKNYLETRIRALKNDDYFESDLAWMDMKSSSIDFIVGPIENYEDGLYGYKAAHESFVLIKDPEWSSKLTRFAALLPALQRTLPVPDAYKSEVPGADSDLGVYDAIYYAGDCNAGSKTIAINLPNDERVHIEKGSRKLQLKNSMRAKFDKILLPIAGELIDENQLAYVKFDAFFENVMFHEVAHGLGIKNTITDGEPVRKALSEQYSGVEEAKADLLGLYLVTQLAAMGELGEKDLMDNYVTFMAGIFRSVRFGASSSHGKANMVQFNYFEETGAFTRNPDTGRYMVNYEQMVKSVSDMAGMILTIQGDGNYEAARELITTKGVMPVQLQAELDMLKEKGIPKDIVFDQGAEALGLN